MAIGPELAIMGDHDDYLEPGKVGMYCSGWEGG